MEKVTQGRDICHTGLSSWKVNIVEANLASIHNLLEPEGTECQTNNNYYFYLQSYHVHLVPQP